MFVGARALNEGGYNAIPKLTFPGGALIGCSAGFLNAVKIKGSHTAMKSGMLAAEALYPLLTKDGEEKTVMSTGEIDPEEKAFEATQYEDAVFNSWIGEELKIIRNSHNAFHHGLAVGMLQVGFSSFISKGNEPWTLGFNQRDCDATLPADQCEKIDYPKPDGKLSFDLLSNLSRSGILGKFCLGAICSIQIILCLLLYRYIS